MPIPPTNAVQVSTYNQGGFRAGVWVVVGPDGWPTGEAVVKFHSRDAAMFALPDVDRRRLGPRLIRADYEPGPPAPPDRGRLLITGLARKTTARDISLHFAGFGLLQGPLAPAGGSGPAGGGAAFGETGVELLLDEEGCHSGEAVLVFVTVAACEAVLGAPDLWDQRLHEKRLGVESLPPLLWDEIDEAWEEAALEEDDDGASGDWGEGGERWVESDSPGPGPRTGLVMSSVSSPMKSGLGLTSVALSPTRIRASESQAPAPGLHGRTAPPPVLLPV